jgi:hypothetical protein
MMRENSILPPIFLREHHDEAEPPPRCIYCCAAVQDSGMSKIGWPESYIHNVYDRMYGYSSIEHSVHTPYIRIYVCMVLANPIYMYVWFWPTLGMRDGIILMNDYGMCGE